MKKWQIIILSILILVFSISIINSVCSRIINIYSDIRLNLPELENYQGHVEDMHKEIPSYTWDEYKKKEELRLWFESRLIDKANQMAKKLNRAGQFKE